MTTYDVYVGGILVASGLTTTTYRVAGPNGTPISGQVSAVTAVGEGPKAGPLVATPTAPVGGGGGGGGIGGAGPRSAPSTPSGITVPGSIDATGATDVSAAMQAWVDSQPDGSTLIFPSGAIYKLGTYGIALENRNNLTFFGYGATLHNYGGSGTRNACFYTGWTTGNSSGIKILGFTIKGSNPAGGTTSAYHAGLEYAQGFGLYKNAVNWEIADCTITDQWGDGIYVSADPAGPYSQGLNFHNNAIVRTGRMGIAVRNGIGLTFADNTITDTAIVPIDIEDAGAGETIHSIWFLRNALNRWSWSGGYTNHAIVGDGPGNFNDIRVQGNVLQGGPQAGVSPLSATDGLISFWGAAAKGTILVDANNASAIIGALPSGSWGMRFQSVNGLTITNNNFTGAGELAHKVGCLSVAQTGNTPA